MWITWDTIISIGAAAGVIASMVAVVLKVHKWYLRQQEQDCELKKMKHENRIICEGLSACLDGLMQLGANHNVPKVKEKLDEHLNEEAHR
jgi:hypothetical protein